MTSKQTTLIPFLTVKDSTKAAHFYVSAFGARELQRYGTSDNNRVFKMAVEEAEFYVGDEEPQFDNVSPALTGATSIRMILVSSNADEIFEKALKGSATQICPMTTEDHWRIGKLRDPFGHVWEIGYPL